MLDNEDYYRFVRDTSSYSVSKGLRLIFAFALTIMIGLWVFGLLTLVFS